MAETRDIVVDGRELTVHVLRVRDAAKVERLREVAKASPVDDSTVQILREQYYPVFAGCTEGDVPTEDEFLDMPNVEANKWFATVSELNPGLFPEPEGKEETKKES